MDNLYGRYENYSPWLAATQQEEAWRLLEGIITKGIGGFYYVKTCDKVYECKARGIFRKKDITPLPGDRVMIQVVDEEKKVGNLEDILPRTSELVRPAVANVNQLVAVVAAKSPVPDLMLLDKLLITAERKGIEVILCINKIDLDPQGDYHNIVEAYTKAGYRVLASSSKSPDGFSQLHQELKGRISVLAGQSGVGKSTLLNRIMNAWVMETGDVSRIERGRHTTRHAELIELENGGYIVDTPGFSSFELLDFPVEELQLYFPEFAPFLNQCRFTGCSHVSEPDCRVKEAIGTSVDEQRHQRYTELYAVLKQQRSYR